MYTDDQKIELQKQYDARVQDFESAARRLRDIVQRVIASIEDKRLVRATVRAERTKSVDSIRRKAEAANRHLDEAILSVNDLIGIRIVCNTIRDVYRFRELLHEALPDDEHIEEQDYIATPKASGYRSLHLNFHVPVGTPFPTVRIPCEVQIRTLLQDSWAELVHSDFYKEGSVLPDGLHDRALDLAGNLAAADETASRIRERVMQETRVLAPVQAAAGLTKESLAQAFADVFGRWPPDYAVQRALEACSELGVQDVAAFRTKLATQAFRESVATAYLEEVRFGPSLSREEVFALVAIAVARGDDEASKRARELGRQDRRNVDEAWRSEVLGSLPATYEEFVHELDEGHINLLQLGEALGVADECFCGESIMDEESFSEAVAQHYDVDVDDDLLDKLTAAAADFWVNPNHPNLCSYHAYQAEKDD